MQPRQIAIIAAAALGAFVVAFGIGKAVSGGSDANAAGAKATVIEAGDVSLTAKAGGADLPALKAAAKKKAKKKSSTSTSTTATAAAPVTTTRPTTSTSTQTTTPTKQTTTKKQSSSGPVSTGGGED